MIKMIFKIIGLIILSLIVFLVLSIWMGGDPFRWLGIKSEQAGEIVREKSEDVAREADRIKETIDSARDTTKKVTEGVRKTEEAIKEFTGSKKDK